MPVDPYTITNLISFWDFQEGPREKRIAKGPNPYQLIEGGGPISKTKGGVFGKHAVFLRKGQWFFISRKDCQNLDIHGQRAQVSVVAWIQRYRKLPAQCEAIAGMWNESSLQRQYCLFLNLPIWNSRDQVGGHVSSTGGPTPGHKYCMEAAIGSTKVPYKTWQCVAMSYDGTQIRAYLNGQLDLRAEQNPYKFNRGLYDPGENGSDFTVGGVSRRGSMGNWFSGLLGGLAVYNRALTESEMRALGDLPTNTH